MKTRILAGVLVSLIVISVISAGRLIAANGKAKETPANDKVGEKAKAPDLEKIEFIHWKKGFGRPGCNNNGICEPELGENPSCADCKNRGGDEPVPTATCYAFMGKYGKRLLKWGNLPVDYVINPSELSESFVTIAISAGAEEWDSYASPELFNDTYVINYSVAYGDLDGNNAISFGNYYLDPDIIAACTAWYNPATKQIVEFDIVFETDYTWGDAGPTNETEPGDPNIMDLQNIATHELGHGVGLADVYEDTCSEVTMYGYSIEGETKKRILEEPDVIGILELYPE